MTVLQAQSLEKKANHDKSSQANVGTLSRVLYRDPTTGIQNQRFVNRVPT